ncbi:hypothetical protein MUK42_12273 [Musa troglodytarum]|uniref:Complex 1 LYR protein domain-containing protein n=2 Tax=Musa troglodytarum TaxID=320322 RepID=A0A9E7GTW5_9LILI|nr:hypothetical protein MUK42_12273 [Musa troglodytarum]
MLKFIFIAGGGKECLDAIPPLIYTHMLEMFCFLTLVVPSLCSIPFDDLNTKSPLRLRCCPIESQAHIAYASIHLSPPLLYCVLLLLLLLLLLLFLCLLPCSSSPPAPNGSMDILDMGSEAMQAAKVYRSLLKAVKKHIGNDGSKRHFRDYITEEFRKNASVSDQATVENKIKLAHEYTFLLNSVHHHKELLFSYNIAVDRSDEMKKVLNKSAASVGLRLPDVYQP